MSTHKFVMGIMSDGINMGFKRLTIRFTSDHMGESLSLSDDKSVMLQVDYKAIEEIVNQERGKNNGN